MADLALFGHGAFSMTTLSAAIQKASYVPQLLGQMRHAAGQQDNTHAYTQKIQLLEAGRTADAARIASLQYNLRSTATQHAQAASNAHAASNAAACRDLANQHQQLAAHLAQGTGVVGELVYLVEQRDAQVNALKGASAVRQTAVGR